MAKVLTAGLTGRDRLDLVAWLLTNGYPGCGFLITHLTRARPKTGCQPRVDFQPWVQWMVDAEITLLYHPRNNSR
jgi:hypothetical protein